MAICVLFGFDFKHESNLSVEQLEKGLLHDLKPLADTFIEIEQEYEIDSVAYASVVALESGWGQSKLSQESNNITSWRNETGYKAYDSKEKCLYDMAENLSENYLSEEGIYYNGGTSIENIACYYLLGKPYNQLTLCETKKVNDYINCLNNIYENIQKRAGE